jgi:hypothetical protein
MAIQFTLNGKPLTVDRSSNGAARHCAGSVNAYPVSSSNRMAHGTDQAILAGTPLPGGAA